MDLAKSINILKGLSKGCKYNTGEIILNYNNKEDKKIIEAVELALSIVEREYSKKNKRFIRNNKNNKPDRNGMSWSKEEMVDLCSVFDKFINDNMDTKDIVCELAFIHQRTLGAIVSRLKKIKKLPNNFYINAYMKRKYKELLK